MARREGVAGAPTLKEAPSGCSNAVCGLVEASESTAGKKTTYKLTVNVGEEAPLTVLSTAPVDVGCRIVVALPGSSIGDADVFEPTLCDAAMLGWKGPSNEIGPALLPKTFAPGDSAPCERPKAVKAVAVVDKLGNVDAAEGVEALFVSKPKLSKEEKEMAKLEKAAAKGDAKAVSKLQHLKLRQAIAAKRAAGEEVYTDDELEAAGLSAP
jgi:hypothetical protein